MDQQGKQMKQRWIALVVALCALGAFAGAMTHWSQLGRTPRTVQVTATSLPSRQPRMPVLPPSISLAGKVVDHGGASEGLVTVRVGDRVSQSSATIVPGFSAVVASTDASEMVVVEVEGPGFKYVSTLGSYGRLARLAGADAVLTLDESDALRVSPISTALSFFVDRRNGGPAESDARFERAMRMLQGQDLWTASVVLSRLAKGSLPAPDGYPHGYALLRDRPAYQDYVGAHYEYTEGGDDVLAAMESSGFAPGDISAATALLGPVADLDAPLAAPYATIIEQGADGFRVHGSYSTRNAMFSGGFDPARDLVLVPVNEVSTVTSEGVCSTGGQVLRKDRLLGDRYRLQRRGDKASLWMGVTEYEVTYLNCADLEPFTYSYVTFGNALDLTPSYPFVDPRRFIGQRALPDFCIASGGTSQAYIKGCEYALHEFSGNGTGTMLELGPKVDASMLPAPANGTAPFSWDLRTAGVLHVDDGQVNTRYWTVDPGEGVSGMVYVAEATDGDDVLSLGGYVGMINGNGAGGFEVVSPVGTWRYGTFEQGGAVPYADALEEEGMLHRFVRRSDGTAGQQSFLPGASYVVEQRSTWRVVGGDFYDTRVFSSPSGRHYDCAAAYAAGAVKCAPRLVRYLRPMARIGNRIYGIQELYTNLSGTPGDPPYQPSRSFGPNYHQLDPTPASGAERRRAAALR